MKSVIEQLQPFPTVGCRCLYCRSKAYGLSNNIIWSHIDGHVLMMINRYFITDVRMWGDRSYDEI